MASAQRQHQTARDAGRSNGRPVNVGAPSRLPAVNVGSPSLLVEGGKTGPVDAASMVALQRTHGNAHVSRVVQRQAGGGVQMYPVPHARFLIKKASAGAGTDEDAIYAAIRQCADRPALKADQEVQKLLRSEMKGHELWKAQLLLEFGDESKFPPAVRAIWGGTEGAGTDEERIYKAIDKLTAGQLDDLLKIPGLEGILKADLNSKEMKRATGGAGVRARHKANVAFVTHVLNEMRKPANSALIRNTAEWLAPSGSGTAKKSLTILTLTHDAAARAKKAGKGNNEVAYFGENLSYPTDTADYKLAITSTTNIYFDDKTVAGTQNSNKIRLMEPKKHGLASVRGFLVHEVQHDADRHDLEPDWAKAYKSPEESWVRYKTEFRSYWLDGDFDPPTYSDTSGSATDPKFDNAKQEAIFLHMYGTGPNDVYAEWVRPNYDGNKTVNGKKFKDLVHGYKQPEGINLVNSPRIDDFYLQLRKCAKTDRNMRNTPLKELKAAAQALNADDRTYVNSAPAAALQKTMKDNLRANIYQQIATIMNGGRLPKWAGGR